MLAALQEGVERGKRILWCGISWDGLSGVRSLAGNLEDNIPGRRNSSSAKALMQQQAKIPLSERAQI